MLVQGTACLLMLLCHKSLLGTSGPSQIGQHSSDCQSNQYRASSGLCHLDLIRTRSMLCN
jgi:hypothetical protein